MTKYSTNKPESDLQPVTTGQANNQNQSLFEPLNLPTTGQIGSLELRNRLVMAPMTNYSSNADGSVTDTELAYYARRSGGVGMVITACANVTANGQGFPGEIGVDRDDLVPSLNRLAQAIQGEGAAAVLQIFHGGRLCPPKLVNGDVVSASAVPAEAVGSAIPRELTDTEVQDIVTAFGDATRRAIEAGYDGVEIHGANGYLLQQFFSPHSNRRTDRWSGDVHGRMAFPLAVVEAVQAAVREHATRPFVVGYRFSPEEPENPGISMPDTLALVDALVETGLDYLHVSLMDYRSLPHTGDVTRPRLDTLVAQLNGRVPLIGVGSVWSADDALAVLAAGAALVALGRSLVVEPDWAQKVEAGQEAQLRTELTPDEQALLVVPDPLWTRILNAPGWFPVAQPV
ncbi:NADH-dependent flavin oxidoreductase (plasmid) [Deinococcus psychrotolerans]|uniref:NADH-dependent flavin oxidoreductase n=1 Tax=Deinococcus psychrotolerans TaxID=2489213 RepID=A0A3G8YIX6_9DEIO|nr:NADH-dependent flavin oxidoreductase [Deinococcus psychrotolerans]AZI45228.1 NADH-dependent flavin oxidoreductase [Deinococcus psychrotolerans]